MFSTKRRKLTDASISDLIFFHILLTVVLAFHVIDVFSLSWNQSLGKSTGGNFSVAGKSYVKAGKNESRAIWFIINRKNRTSCQK